MSVLTPVNEWVAVAANWLSLASLLVSIYAAVMISRVRRDIAGRVMLPGLVAALEESNRTFAVMLRDFETNEREFGLELARCEANIRVVSIAPNAAARAAKGVLAQIGAFRRRPSKVRLYKNEPKSDQAWAIYESLNGLLEELKRVSIRNQIGA